MPLIREYQGLLIRRTRRLGNLIEIRFRTAQAGQPGPRILVPLAQYLAERKTSYHAPVARSG